MLTPKNSRMVGVEVGAEVGAEVGVSVGGDTVETGFEFVCDFESANLFRKRNQQSPRRGS